MMMTLPLQENTDYIERPVQFEPRPSSTYRPGNNAERAIHLFAEKLRIPKFDGGITRPRLNELLEKSCTQFGATLVSGRAGTGKTIIAANFADRYKDVAWYSVESADRDWSVFSHYFNAALMKTDMFGKSSEVSILEPSHESAQEAISRFITDLFSQSAGLPAGNSPLVASPLLIVLDDIQHLFDADWFNDFFTLLLHSLPPDVHLLMLCRSKPPLPLWRLRSKQRLNVIDEKLLAFSPDEAERLYKIHGLPGDVAKRVHRASYGRASKLTGYINTGKIREA
jgi:LuxR family maltose regulon positive regulatory protein